MPSSSIRKFWALPLLLGLYLACMIYLFKQRFDVGDVYPPYSTFRADPVGARMLYESFRQLPRRTCERDIEPLYKLPKDGNRTLFSIGEKAIGWFPLENRKRSQVVDDFIRPGSRLVLAFFPEISVNRRRLRERETRNEDVMEQEEEPDRKSEKPKKKSQKVQYGFNSALLSHWGVEMNFLPLSEVETTNHLTVALDSNAASDIETEMSWHSGLVLTNLSAAWTVIYRRDNHPVLAERKWGSGSIVIATDSYVLSNESLWKERYPKLLTWLAGSHPHILFDEVHLGTETQGGVMVLARKKYRLHGFFIGLVLLFLLIIWQSSSSFIPRYTDEVAIRERRLAQGRDAASGLNNLILRNIPRKDLLQTCFLQWRKANPAEVEPNKIQRITQYLENEKLKKEKEQDPVKCYRQVHSILKERKQTRERSA